MESSTSHTPRIAHLTTIDLTLRFLLLGQMTRLRDEGFDVSAISAPGPWVRDLEAEGIRHIPWEGATRSWAPRADGRAFVELVRILRKERFDLLHTHNPKPGILGRVAARLAGTTCVVNTVHGFYAMPEDRLARKGPVLALEWLAGRFSDLELFQSQEDLAWASKLRLIPARRRVFLGNGTDLARFDSSALSPQRIRDVRRALGFDENAVVIGAVGRLVAEKGYREFFSAAKQVRAAVPNARFLAVGGVDPAKADAITEEEMERARQDVVFTGWRLDVDELLGAMDVFVLPSYREGVPRSAIEAAAAGKPLVLTDIRGCREVARDGIEGLLVRPRDEVGLAEAITELATDSALRERMGAAARARAIERFDEKSVSDTVVACYRRLLARRGLYPAAYGGRM